MAEKFEHLKIGASWWKMHWDATDLLDTGHFEFTYSSRLGIAIQPDLGQQLERQAVTHAINHAILFDALPPEQRPGELQIWVLGQLWYQFLQDNPEAVAWLCQPQSPSRIQP